VSVRRADPGDPVDAGALRALRRAWTEEDVGGPLDDPTFEGRLADWFVAESGHRRYFLVEDGETPIGMASLVVMRRMPRPGRPDSEWGYVHQVFVQADHRGRGVGAALVDAVAAAARADGLSQLVLNPTPRSVPFYVRSGFVPAGHLLWRTVLD
jgi:GNAT superfamily N-acetyltransferase